MSDDITPGPVRPDGPEWERVKREAAERAAEVARALLRPAGELAAEGTYLVAVAHGEPEDGQEAARVFGLADLAYRAAGEHECRVEVVGRSDSQTFVFREPGAQQAASEFEEACRERASSWWRITGPGGR